MRQSKPRSDLITICYGDRVVCLTEEHLQAIMHWTSVARPCKTGDALMRINAIHSAIDTILFRVLACTAHESYVHEGLIPEVVIKGVALDEFDLGTIIEISSKQHSLYLETLDLVEQLNNFLGTPSK